LLQTQAALDQTLTSQPDKVQTDTTQPGEAPSDSTRTAAPSTKKKTATPTPRPSAAYSATPASKKNTLAPANFGDFDYFVLALSWAPDFCSSNNDPQECAIGRKLGFVLHGLWPQYNVGYPSTCSNVKLPADVRAQFTNIYPNDSLIVHEWEKHGTCSGLIPRDYLSLSRQIKESVVIPAAYINPQEPFRVTTTELKTAFIQDNPAFSEFSLEPGCSGSGRFLAELYVCFAKDGSPASCGADVHKTALKSCAQKDFLVRNTR
jgi:ribonuclease T2